MPTREEFLRLIWDEVINAPVTDAWINHVTTASSRDTDKSAPFADAGESLARLLAMGVDRRDIFLVTRWAIYEAVFSVLYMLDDPGVDDGQVFMLHESLLGADPSGKEGRLGSAP